MPAYYIKRGENVKGPFEKSQLRELLDSGKLKPTDQVREEQSGAWTSLENFLKKPKAKSKSKGKSRQKASPPIGLIAAGVIGVCVLISVGIYFSGMLGSPAKTTDVAEVVQPDEPSAEPRPDSPPSDRANRSNGSPASDFPSEIDLASLVSIEDGLIRGTWVQTEDGLRSGSTGVALLELPIIPPDQFQVDLRIRKESETGQGFGVCLPVEGQGFVAYVGGHYGTGLMVVDGKDYPNNSAFNRNRFIGVGEDVDIRIIVEGPTIKVFVDNKEVINWTSQGEKLTLPRNWAHPNRTALAISTGQAEFTILSMNMSHLNSAPRYILPPKIVSQSAKAMARRKFGPALDGAIAIAERIGGQVRVDRTEAGYQRLFFSVQNKGVAWKTISDEDLVTLSKLQGPVTLVLTWLTKIPEQGFLSLKDMEQLEVVDFGGSKGLTDEMFRQLPAESLHYFGVKNSTITDSVADHLAKMKNLISVHLHQTNSGDGLLKVLGQLPKLNIAVFGGSDISDEGIEQLCRNKSLEVIRIWNTASDSSLKVTDKSLQSFSKLPALKVLAIQRTNIKESSVEAFRKTHPQVELVFKPVEVVPEVLEEAPKVVIKPDQSVPILKMLEKYPDVKRLFDQRMERAKSKIERYAKQNRNGHIVVGRLQLEGDDDPEAIVAQMIVLKDGFFVGAIHDPKKTVGFSCHQYRPLRLTVSEHAVENNDGVFDVGVIRMTKAPTEELGNVTGTIDLEGKTGVASTNAILMVSYLSINSISGTDGVGQKHPRIKNPVQPDGTFIFEGLSEGVYSLYLSRDGHVSVSRRFQVKRGETTKLGRISLDLQREVTIEYLVEKTPVQKFDIRKKQTVTIKTDEPFKSRKDIYGWDFKFVSTNQELQFEAVYFCTIMDLGEGLLSDFQDIDVGTFKGAVPSSISPKAGHVYLVNQGHWKHYVLFRINSVER